MENPIREEIERNNTLFNRLFTKYQTNLRKDPNYIKFEAFKDMKIIFELYSKIYSFRSYSYNEVSIETFSKLTSCFDCYRNKELFEYLALRLIKEGNDDKLDEIKIHIQKLEIICLWNTIKSKKSIFTNVPFSLPQQPIAYRNTSILSKFTRLSFNYAIIITVNPIRHYSIKYFHLCI